MPQPYDYTLGNVPDPAASFMQGLQRGVGMQQIDVQRQQQQLVMQAEAQKMEQQRARAAALQELRDKPNPTLDDYRRTMAVLPDLHEALGKGASMLNDEQEKNALGEAGETLAALRQNRPDIAASLLRKSAELVRATDQKSADAREAIARTIDMDPLVARDMITFRTLQLKGGDKLIDAITKIGTEDRAQAEAPAKLAKAEADAKTAAVTAKYADSQALADLEKKGWDVKAIQADIGYKRESNRIAAMNAAAAQMNARAAGEGNALKRQELQLKIDDAVKARDDKVREKVATAEAGANNIDNMLNTIQRIKKNPSLDDVLGSYEGRISPIVGSALDDEESDAIGLIETLGSQAFLAQIPSIKGMGALSNAEGDKLQNALQNLSRAQSEKQFRANLEEAARLLTKGRESLSKSTGVPLGKPDTPAAPGARPPLSSFNKP